VPIWREILKHSVLTSDQAETYNPGTGVPLRSARRHAIEAPHLYSGNKGLRPRSEARGFDGPSVSLKGKRLRNLGLRSRAVWQL